MYIGELVRDINNRISLQPASADLYLNSKKDLNVIGKLLSLDKLSRVSNIILSGLQTNFVYGVSLGVDS